MLLIVALGGLTDKDGSNPQKRGGIILTNNYLFL
jgi:hypothetical protein